MLNEWLTLLQLYVSIRFMHEFAYNRQKLENWNVKVLKLSTKDRWFSRINCRKLYIQLKRIQLCVSMCSVVRFELLWHWIGLNQFLIKLGIFSHCQPFNRFRCDKLLSFHRIILRLASVFVEISYVSLFQKQIFEVNFSACVSPET